MHLLFEGTIRGEPVSVRLRDGQLTGDAVLLSRVDTSRIDLSLVGSVVQELERVAGQQLHLRVIDDLDGEHGAPPARKIKPRDAVGARPADEQRSRRRVWS